MPATRPLEDSPGDHSSDTKRARAGESGGSPFAPLEAQVSTIQFSVVGVVSSVLAGKGGELFLGTRTALYLQVHGRIALIAGHSSEAGFRDAMCDKSRFSSITGLVMERGGSVLVSDCGNHSVRRVSPKGQVTTVAGNGESGFADGVGDAARFNRPQGIDVDRQGLIYVADSWNHCVRRVHPADGTVSTLCGKGKEPGCANGLAAEARFRYPSGLALDMNEDLIVADECNHNVRKVALPDGRVTMVAGSVEGGYAGQGFADGTGTAARFNCPAAVAVDRSNAILVADFYNHRVRKISGEGRVVTTVAGHGEAGNVDGAGTTARFNKPFQLSIDEEGQLVVCHCFTQDCIRVVKEPPLPGTGALLEAGLSGTVTCTLSTDNMFKEYTGAIKHGKPHGPGTLTCRNGHVCRAMFAQGQISGEATVTFAAGDQRKEYIGAVKNCGVFHGPGVLTFKNGEVWDGFFQNHKANGAMTITYAAGDHRKEYKGTMKDGKADGHGVLTFKDGEVHDGMFENGMANGAMTITYAAGKNEKEYKGAMKDGKEHGYGVRTFKDGEVHDGIFENGIANGAMTITYAAGKNAKEYKGTMKDGKIYGHGVLTFKSGEVHHGMFENGMANGAMTITYAAGDHRKEYKGTMKDGKRDGHGVLTFKNGEVHDGMFKNGLFTGTVYLEGSQPPPAANGSDAAWDMVRELADSVGRK